MSKQVITEEELNLQREVYENYKSLYESNQISEDEFRLRKFEWDRTYIRYYLGDEEDSYTE